MAIIFDNIVLSVKSAMKSNCVKALHHGCAQISVGIEECSLPADSCISYACKAVGMSCLIEPCNHGVRNVYKWAFPVVYKRLRPSVCGGSLTAFV